MDPQLATLAIIFERECHHIIALQALPTKLRFVLQGGYVCDLFFRSRTGGYSYVLVKDEQRVMGCDNASHHPHIPTAPHHFHTPDGAIDPSPSLVTRRGTLSTLLGRSIATWKQKRPKER